MHSVTEKLTRYHRNTSRLALWTILLGLCLMGLQARALQTVVLAWDANSETNLAGYKLYYGTSSRAYTNVVNIGNLTTFSLPNLVDGVTYYFALTAYNSMGVESDFSAEVISLGGGGVFKVLSFTPAPTGGFTLTWPSTPGTIYRVRARTSLAQTNWNNRSGDITASATTTSWTDANLGTARARFYRVELVTP